MHTAVAIRNPLFFFDTHRGGKPTLMGRMIDEEFTALRARAKEIDLTSIKEEPAQGTVFKYR